MYEKSIIHFTIILNKIVYNIGVDYYLIKFKNVKTAPVEQ